MGDHYQRTDIVYNMAAHVGRTEIETKLKEWGIDYTCVEHPEVFTVEQALPHISHLEGIFAKNLFLKDKKKRLYLFCAPHDAAITLNDLAKLVGASGGLRFADESVLQERLGLKQGAVTIFGVVNDTEGKVQLVLDSQLVDGTYQTLYFHPMVNSATIGVSVEGLKMFLEKVNHEPRIVITSGDS